MPSLYRPDERLTVPQWFKQKYGADECPPGHEGMWRLGLTSQVVDSYHFFASNFVWITDKKKRRVNLRPLVIQAIHRVAIDAQLRAGLPGYNVEFKPRQVGGTVENIGRALHYVLNEDSDALILVDDEDVANKQALRFNAMLNGLPGWMQPMRRLQSLKQIAFENPNPKDRMARPGLNSGIQITVPSSFRGVPPGFVCISEYAHMDAERQDQVQQGIISAASMTPNSIIIIDTTPCIAAGTLVSTDVGLIPIEEMHTAIGVQTPFGKVTRFWPKGKREVVRVRTRRGLEVVATPDHRFSTESGWVCAQDLLGHEVRLGPLQASSKYQDVIGQKIDERMGRFLGYFVGDGCCTVRTGAVKFSCTAEDTDTVDDVRELMREMQERFPRGDVRRVPTRDIAVLHKGGCTHLTMVRIRLAEFLQEVGVVGDTKRTICVPQCILESPPSVVAAFLSGLFESDGHSHRHSTQITLTAKQRGFLRDVQLLLVQFDIVSKIHGHQNHAWRLVMNAADSRKFNEQIGFLSERKRTKAAFFGARPPRRKPDTGWLDHDVVVSVEPAGREVVYDLTIDGAPQFVANGFVVHNCGFDDSYYPMVMEAVAENPKWTRRIEGWNAAKQGELTAERVLNGELGIPDSVERGYPTMVISIGFWRLHEEYDCRSKVNPLGELPPLTKEQKRETESSLGRLAKYGGDEETELRDRYGVSTSRLFWRRRKIDRYKLKTEEMRLLTFRQEFAGSTIEEGFVESGKAPFPRDCLDALRRQKRHPAAIGLFEGEGRFAHWEHNGEAYRGTATRDPNQWQQIRIYAPPENGEKYTMGVDCDVAYESEDSDATVAQIVRFRDSKLVATYEAKVGSHELIKQLYCLYRWYWNCYYAIETAGMGYDLVRRCIDASMGNSYYYKRIDKDYPEPTSFPGWESSKPFARAQMDQMLLEMICHRNPATGRPEPSCIIPDGKTINEICNLSRTPSGSFKSSRGRDDHCDALEIAWCIAVDPYSGMHRQKAAEEEQRRHEYEQGFAWITGQSRDRNHPDLSSI